MRDLLTVFAVALIAVLVAALAGPHFVDWTSQRGRIDAALGEALGFKVETRGAISLRLLPAPVLQLEGARIGSAADAKNQATPSLATGNLRVELALAPLLGGKWQIADAVIDRPVLRLVWPPSPGASAATSGIAPALDALRISNGAVIVTDRRGATILERDAITAQVQAGSLAGPWRASGVAGDAPFTLTTGELDQNGAMRLRASIGEAASGRTSFDGQALFGGGSGGTGDAGAGLKGRLTFATEQKVEGAQDGDPSPTGVGANRPAHLSANIAADLKLAGNELKASNIRVEIANPASAASTGSPGAQAQFEGSGGGTIGASAGLTFDLAARRLDVTALSRAVDGDAFTSFMAGVQDAVAFAAPLPDATVRLAIDVLALGEEEAGPARMDLRVSGGALTLQGGRLALPGAVLEASGNARVAPRPFLAASPRLVVTQPAVLAAWLKRAGAPEITTGWLARQTRLALAGQIGVSRETLSLHDLRLTTGVGDLSGLIASRSGDVRTPGRLDAQLSARGLDLADLPLPPATLSGWMTSEHHTEGGLTFTGEQLRLGATGPLGAVRLRVNRSGGDVDIALLDVNNLGGVDISAAGRLGGKGAVGKARKPLKGEISAPGLAPLAILADRVGIGGGAWLQQAVRSPVFARLTRISFGAEPQPDGGVIFRFTGDAATLGRGEGRVDLAAPGAGRFAHVLGGQITVSGGDAADLAGLLAPTGALLAAPPPGQGPWRAVVDLSGGGAPAALDAQAAGARLLMSPDVGGARLNLTADNAGNLARMLGWPQPDPGPLKLEGRLDWADGAGAAAQASPWRLSFSGNIGGGPVSGMISPLGGGPGERWRVCGAGQNRQPVPAGARRGVSSRRSGAGRQDTRKHCTGRRPMVVATFCPCARILCQ